MKIKYKYAPRLLFLSAFMMIVPPLFLAAVDKVPVTILMILYGILFFFTIIIFYGIVYFRIKQNRSMAFLNRIMKWFLVGFVVFIVVTQLIFTPIFNSEIMVLSHYSLIVLTVFSILQTAPLVWALGKSIDSEDSPNTSKEQVVTEEKETVVNFENVGRDKAEKILLETETLLTSTLMTRSELEKKAMFILGYCLLGIIGLISFIFLFDSRLDFYIFPIVVYAFGLIYIASLLVDCISLDDHKLGGNLFSSLTKSGDFLNQQYEVFTLEIARELDDQIHHNIEKNQQKALFLTRGMRCLINLSSLSLFLVFVIFIAESMWSM